jgi:hypothetical protein
MENSVTCPCCGYNTITGTFDICNICGWEHDPVQESDPDHDDMGPNRVTLREGQRNFVRIGGCDPRTVRHNRRPGPDDVRDPNWKPLEQGNPEG